MGTRFFGSLLLISMIALLVGRKIKQSKIDEIYQLKSERNFEACFSILNGFFCKIVFSTYEYLLLRLNLAIEANSENEIDLCLTKIDQGYMKSEKHEQLLMMIFLYYADHENHEGSLCVIEKLEKSGFETSLKDAQKLYTIFVEKEGLYIEEMKKELVESENSEKRAELILLLCKQYENIGDFEKESQCIEMLRAGV